MLDDSVPLRKQFNTIFSGLDAKGLNGSYEEVQNDDP